MTGPVKGVKWALYPRGDVTQYFSENPTLYASMNMKGHNGIDIVRPWGEPMYAVEDCTVSEIKRDTGGYGAHIRLKSKDGKREWTYGHCSEILVLNIGQPINEGDMVAKMGNTGFVVSGTTPYWHDNPYAGTHLHFGLRLYKNGKVQNYNNGYFGSINPLSYFVPKLSDRLLLTNETSAIASVMKAIGL